MPNIFIPFIKRADATKRKQELWNCLFWLLVGSCLGFSAPGFGLWPLAWVGLVPLFFGLSQANDRKSAFHRGFWFGAGYHYTYLCWYVGLYPMAWMGFSPWQSAGVALGAWSLASLYGALFIGFLATAFWEGFRRFSACICLLGFPLLWMLTFWGFKQTDFGVPWALLEYTQAALPWMRNLASLSGQWLGDSSLITVLLVLHNLAIFFLLKQKKPLASGLLTLGIPLTLWGLSYFPFSNAAQAFPLPVVLLQGNLPIEVIRNPQVLQQEAGKAYLDPLSSMPLQAGTLVVLPEEGAVPGWVSLQNPFQNPALHQLAKIAWQRNISLITGISSYDPKTRNTYNSLVLITDPQTPLQFYHKRHLVPFGEYTPYVDAQWASQQLTRLGVSYETAFQRGTQSQPLQLPAGKHHPALKLGSLICFELIYPEFSRDYHQDKASLLVNASNLGWFHTNPWLEAQFLAIGQLRAAETGIPLVIATNSGVSAFISASGAIQQRSPSGQKAVLRTHPSGS